MSNNGERQVMRITEAQIMQRPAPDFDVRRMDDYTPEDLDVLFTAVLLAHSNQLLTTRERDALGIWSYRVGDALKEARKRKALGHYNFNPYKL